jgi:Leucine-rich repeat (LRR) protein
MDVLLELDLRNCSISTISENSFVNVSNLQKLFLSHNSIGFIRDGTFNKLVNLIHLDLSYNNFIKHSALFPDPFSEYFSGLMIHEKSFENLKNLEFLDLSHSKLVQKSVKSFKWLPASLKQLSLCYTNVPFIMDGMFNGSKLQILDLSGNPNLVSYLKFDSFDGLKNTLEILMFRNASVKSLKYFKTLHKLRMLDLRYNNINLLQLTNLEELLELEILDLGSNHISTWMSRVFEKNRNLSVINLRNNNINYLTGSMLMDYSSIEFIAMGSNNFFCECVLRTFFEMAAQNALKLYCIEILENDDEDELSKNQSSSYNVLSRKYENYGKYIRNSTVNIRKAAIQKQVNEVNAQQFKLQMDLPINCKEYDTHNEEFHADFENSFILIDYNKNDYKCHEPTQNKDFFFDAVPPCKRNAPSHPPDEHPPNKTEEETTTIITTTTTIEHSTKNTDSDYYFRDPLDIEKVVAIAVLIIIIFIIVYFWKGTEIKYFFILFRNTLILSSPNDSSNDKRHLLSFMRKRKIISREFCYDVFVSYSDKDRDWILNYLLPNIERRKEINVCLHERDFQVGLSILENIISCMDQVNFKFNFR